MENNTPIDKLLDHYGNNITHTAQALNKSRQNVQIWIRQGYIPWREGERVEIATHGAITKQEVWEAAAKVRHH